MNVRVRTAGPADLATVQELWRAFESEVPEPPHVDPDPERELAEIEEIVAGEVALVAEDDDGRTLGMALARGMGSRRGRLTDLYVVPEARNAGVATALLSEVIARLRERGLAWVDLEVVASNAGARAVYERWGFSEDTITLVASLDVLEQRFGTTEAGESFGSIHVQTDDVGAIVRAVEIYVPRLPGRSRGSIVSQPRGGYVAVYDDVADRDPAMLRRLAREISSRTGLVTLALGVESGAVARLIVLDRGRVVDEYASVPEYHGPLPPGDVVGFAANPTVIHRLTGADAGSIRRIARTAPVPADLPPARELLRELAAALGVEGSEHGWSDAPGTAEGWVTIHRS